MGARIALLSLVLLIFIAISHGTASEVDASQRTTVWTMQDSNQYSNPYSSIYYQTKQNGITSSWNYLGKSDSRGYFETSFAGFRDKWIRLYANKMMGGCIVYGYSNWFKIDQNYIGKIVYMKKRVCRD